MRKAVAEATAPLHHLRSLITIACALRQQAFVLIAPAEPENHTPRGTAFRAVPTDPRVCRCIFFTPWLALGYTARRHYNQW